MSPKMEKAPINVVNIDSSDDEDNLTAKTRTAPSKSPPTPTPTPTPTPSQSKPQMPQNSEINTPSTLTPQTVANRSFWKAGDYEIGPIAKIAPASGELEHAPVHPKFLHSNATSHKWAFGAIAELLDNAVDEVHNGATFVKLDRIGVMKNNSPALLFQDDGGGMDSESMRKCMSLGYSSKKANTTIGQYGNGFKTSTMRLGADVIVFSRAIRKGKATQTVGLLSYTFLRRTGQDDVIVPMIDFDISANWAEPIIFGSQDDWSANLKTILEWSPFKSKEELLLQFEDIGSHGTKVIIYNLWLNDEGVYELSFDDDDEDIRLRDEARSESLTKVNKKTAELQSHISYRIRYSLRAYASILYLRKFTNFRIILRGKPVQQFNIADEFRHRKVVIYKPQLAAASKEVTVETTIGFIKEAPALNVSGFNVYHKNRLIRPFWKVTSDGSSKGNGVVGVLEANFIEPAHDKQDFERSSLFIKLETRLKQMVMDYWKGHCHFMGYQPLNKPRERPVQPPVGLAANIHEVVHLDQPFVGLPANTRQISTNEHPGIGSRTVIQKDLPAVLPNIELAEGPVKEVTSLDGSGFTSVDQICEENIQLFMRCEERLRKETEMRQMIEALERELKEAKSKCAQLSAHLERKKKIT